MGKTKLGLMGGRVTPHILIGVMMIEIILSFFQRDHTWWQKQATISSFTNLSCGLLKLEGCFDTSMRIQQVGILCKKKNRLINLIIQRC